MTINFKDDLFEGAVVEYWEPKDNILRHKGYVRLIEKRECREYLTLIHDNSVYAYECWKVVMPDGFETTRKIYFLIADHYKDVPEEYIDQYTYNLYYESKEYLNDRFEKFDSNRG